jgi:PAS domain-containing protein
MSLTPVDLKDALLGLGGISVAALAVQKAYITFSRSTKERLALLTATSEAIARMEPALAGVQREVTANGGASLKDVVTSMRDEIIVERTARRVLSTHANYEVSIPPATGIVQMQYVSPEFVVLTGLSRDECDRDGWVRFVAAEDRERVQRLAIHAQQNGHVFSIDYIGENVQTGNRVGITQVGTPIISPKGVVIGWIGVMRPKPKLLPEIV